MLIGHIIGVQPYPIDSGYYYQEIYMYLAGFHAILLAYLILIGSASAEKLKYRKIKLHTYELGGHLHHLEMKVGTPPQKQSFLLDTGSSTLVIKSSDCSNCVKSEFDGFDRQKSSTYQELMCYEQFYCSNYCTNKISKQACRSEIVYGDGTTVNGIYSKDVISFEQDELQDSFTGKLLRVQQMTSSWRMKQNGILGVGPNMFENVLYYLGKSRKNSQKIQYTICLAERSGYLQIGEEELSDETEPNLTAPISHPSSYLSILNVASFTLGSVDLLRIKEDSSYPYQIVMDSGASISFMPTQVYVYFEDQILTACTQSLNCQYQITKNQQGFKFVFFTINRGSSFLTQEAYVDKILPPLVLEINGNKYAWKASEYCRQSSSNSEQQFLTLQISNQTSIFILGKNWLLHKRVRVDLSSNKVSVWMNADCRFSTSFWDNLIPDNFKHFAFNLDSGTILYFCLFAILMIVVFRKKCCRFIQIMRWKMRSKKAEVEIVSEQMNEVGSSGKN